MIVLMIGAALYSTGYGPLTSASLTQDEKLFIDQLEQEVDALCTATGSAGCRTKLEGDVLKAASGRRIFYRTMRETPLADEMSYKCSTLTDILLKLNCFSDLGKLSYENAMNRLGLSNLGVTRSAYNNIRMGMTYRDVEHILGQGEESAHSSIGGQSSSMYVWQRGRAMIIVSFTNSRVSSRSQSGL